MSRVMTPGPEHLRRAYYLPKRRRGKKNKMMMYYWRQRDSWKRLLQEITTCSWKFMYSWRIRYMSWCIQEVKWFYTGSKIDVFEMVGKRRNWWIQYVGIPFLKTNWRETPGWSNFELAAKQMNHFLTLNALGGSSNSFTDIWREFIEEGDSRWRRVRHISHGRDYIHLWSDIKPMAEREDINCIFPPHESVRFTTGFTRFAGNFMEDQVCNPAICVEKVLHTQKAQTQISVFCADRAKSRSIQEAAQSHRYVHTGAPICLYIYRHLCDSRTSTFIQVRYPSWLNQLK